MLPANARANDRSDFLLETDFSTQLGDGAQCAFGTLPPSRFKISKRGQRGLTGEFRALRKQHAAANGLTDDCILPHHHGFEKCFDRASADLAQIGRCNPHPHLLGEQFDQHHDAAFAIGHLVDAFDTGKWRFVRRTRSPSLTLNPLGQGG